MSDETKDTIKIAVPAVIFITLLIGTIWFVLKANK